MKITFLGGGNMASALIGGMIERGFAAGDIQVVELGDEARAALEPLAFGPTVWKDWTELLKASTGRKGKGLFRPLRRALTGLDAGPEMADVMPLLQVVRAH